MVGSRADPATTEVTRAAVHDRLKTPSADGTTAAGVAGTCAPAGWAKLGNSACSRLFQVINGTAASIRLSVPASMSAKAPP